MRRLRRWRNEMREIRKIRERSGLEIVGDNGPNDGSLGRGSAREIISFGSEEARDLYIQIIQIKDDYSAARNRIESQDRELVEIKTLRGAWGNLLRVLKWEIEEFFSASKRCGY
jgi:hypothetical protein